MNAKLLLVLIVVFAVISGCGPVRLDGGNPPPERMLAKSKVKAPKPCNGGDCTSMVDISDCTAGNPSPNCTISYDVVLLAKGRQVRATFSITSGFQFNEIKFDRSDLIACAAKQTPPGNTDWECKGDNVDYGIYKFTIDVKNVSAIDPWLVND